MFLPSLFLRISDFSEVLLRAIDNLLEWPDKVKLMQKNWIGKSTGAHINFKVNEQKETIRVFTTRPDTIFGASFIALSPQHPFSEKIKSENEIVKNKLNDY